MLVGPQSNFNPTSFSSLVFFISPDGWGTVSSVTDNTVTDTGIVTGSTRTSVNSAGSPSEWNFQHFFLFGIFHFLWWMTRSFPSTHREMSANEKERWWRNGINMKKAATRGKTQIWYKHGTNRWHHVSSKWTVEIQNLCPWPLEVLNLCPHPVSKRGRREHLSFQTRKKGNIAHYSFQIEKGNITNCSFHGSRGQPDRRQSSI